jgi:hypothetical protein
VFDSARDTFNVVNDYLRPNTSDAEVTGSANDQYDFLSNGFKLRGSGSFFNASGQTYIYAAFAESPFNFSRAR